MAGVGGAGASQGDGAPVEAGLWSPRSLLVHGPERLGANQIWATAQDSRGFLYAAGNSEIFQYDGDRWRSLSALTSMRHLVVTDNDRIVLGGGQDFGVLDADTGEYESLLTSLPEDQRSLQRIRTILSQGSGVLVASESYLHRVHDDGTVEILLRQTSGEIREAFLWQERIYIDTSDDGLLEVVDGVARPVNGAGRRAFRVVGIVGRPPDAGTAWVFTVQDGTFRLDDGHLASHPLAADPFLIEHRVSNVTELPEGRLLVTTRRGGAVVLDSAGRIEEVFDHTRYPKLNNSVYHGLVDAQGGFWLATDAGVAQVPSSPLRQVVEPSGVEGTLHRAYWHRGRFYVATRTGLYRQHPVGVSPRSSELETVPGIDSGTWALHGVGDVLLVGTHEGIFALLPEGDGTRAEKLCDPLTVSFFSSRRTPGRIYSGSRGGPRPIRFEGGRWRCGPAISGIDGLVYQWVETEREDLLKLSDGRLLGLELAEDLAAAPRVRRYAAPEDDFHLLDLGDRILLSDDRQGIFRYLGPGSEGTFPFEADTSLGGLRPPGGEGQVVFDYEPEHDRLWLATSGVIEVAERPEPGAPYVRRWIAADEANYWSDIHRDPARDRYWITHRTGVFLWDPNWTRVPPSSGTHLRQANSLRDRTDLLHLAAGGAIPRVAHGEGGVRFEFAAPVFDQLTPSEYQVQLVGFDDAWSDWSSETTKEYTNLWEGRYRFRVRNRDRWGLVGAEDHFDFVVTPPAHRAPWAYGLYFLGLCGVVALALRAHGTKLARERAISERRSAQVEERGRLLRERDRLIGELEARNTELARFNYTVSHDLKNPLTTIKNFIGLARHDAARGASERLEQDFDRLEGAANRLHRLLDDLFALSQTEGRNQAHRALDFGEVVAVALSDLADLVAQTRVVVEVAEGLPEVWGDRRQLVELVRQLLGNALVFVSSRRPRVAIRARDGDEGPVFEVQDNGIGIEAQYHEKVFGLFERLDPDSEGTGVGLALAQRVVEAHGGRLWVESEGLGKGSTFCFTLAPRPADRSPSGS